MITFKATAMITIQKHCLLFRKDQTNNQVSLCIVRSYHIKFTVKHDELIKCLSVSRSLILYDSTFRVQLTQIRIFKLDTAVTLLHFDLFNGQQYIVRCVVNYEDQV